ncbi:hypothetical protein EVAR_90178_1 [Eumeta japonica]|uniref:Uncharacterized protein n=1 Tax=Eumeta variegata TaxID=151549 RepID=A0A4C1WUE3_EUMVA|nr:hypothetical protein EVAR_90178_1 [Eumeta japonica]
MYSCNDSGAYWEVSSRGPPQWCRSADVSSLVTQYRPQVIRARQGTIAAIYLKITYECPSVPGITLVRGKGPVSDL